jgi:hypothetical protein
MNRWPKLTLHPEDWYLAQWPRFRPHRPAPRWEIIAEALQASGAPVHPALCEVGVFEGMNARHLNDLGPAELALVDTWRCEPLAAQIAAGNWPAEYHLLPSLEGAKLYPDGHFDLVYIDACHDYPAVRDDIAAWLPKVRPGGVLAGHDWQYGDRDPDEDTGVRRAVLEREEFAEIHLALDPTCAGNNRSWWVYL